MKYILLTILFTIAIVGVKGQCNIGEVEVEIIVHTDDYGYEAFWELIPNGNNCGTGTIAQGGNLTVGCSGAGLQAQEPSGYGDNMQITEGPWCLTEGALYDLVYVDDWGDGGFAFDIVVNGYIVQSFDGVGLGATFTFTAEEPPAYDLEVFGSNIYSYVSTGSFDLDAHVFNGGTTTITSYDLNYTVNGGGVNTHNVTATSLVAYASEDVNHSIPLNIATNGVFTIKVWADNLNGGLLDLDNSNDTLTKQTEAGPGTPNIIDDYVGINPTVVLVAGASEQVSGPTDLDFHPVLSNKELWITNKGTENSGGSTVTLYNAGDGSQTSIYKQDGNAYHFMSLPTGIAFSENGNWANSPGVYDANHDGGAAFTGPALWSSDMSVYAEPSGGNGSHLDMLHHSPECQGIAAEKDNVFWIFDGYNSDIVRYDFAEDHGPGASFHGDAIIRRYSDDAVTKDPTNTVVSHLVLDETKQWLYAVDHGNNRVIRIDITTGSNQGGTPSYPSPESVVEYSVITGYTQENVLTGLNNPAGIDVIDNRMVISEYNSGDIVIYDISTLPAIELSRISTGLTSVQGVKIGPAGRIWFVDENSNGVYKLDAAGLNVSENEVNLVIYPNPSDGAMKIESSTPIDGEVRIYNIQGKLVHLDKMNGMNKNLNLNLDAGVYIMKIMDGLQEVSQEKLIIK
jgi:hypothetical protein